MKKTFILCALAAITFWSCQRETLDPLSGKFPAPEEASVSNLKLDKYTAEKPEKLYHFNIELSGNGTSVKLSLLSNKYQPSSSYSPEAKADATKGNFIMEETTVNGEATAEGRIDISNLGNQYTIKAVLFTVSGKPYRFTTTVTMDFVKPDPVLMTNVLSATSNVPNGTNSVTLVFATDGVAISGFDMTTFTNSYSGTGYAWSIDLYSADGYIKEGVYAACEKGGEIEPGQFGIGYDFDLAAYGMEGFAKWGTNWFSVDDGASTLEQVTSGEIIVTRNEEGEWVFTMDNDVAYCIFTGDIPAVTKDETAWPTVDLKEAVLFGSSSDVAAQTVTVQFSTEGLSTPFDRKSEGYYLNLVLNSKDGYLHEGTYTAGDGSKGTFLAGYDSYEGGVNLNQGTTIWHVSGTVAEARKLTEGSVTVTRDEDVWTFVMENERVVLTFEGEIPDLTSDGVLISDVDPSVLTQVLSVSYNGGYGTPTYTLNFATEDLSYVVGQYGGTFMGTGYRLSLDIYSPDGKLYEGVYKACAEGGTVGEGEFGIGYDTIFYGQQVYNWGTCWWTYDKKAETYEVAQKILDGTVAVVYDAETEEFTIALESSVINTAYTGPIDGVEGVKAEDTYDGIKVDRLVSYSDNSASSKIVSLDFWSEGVSGEYDPATWSTTYSGNGYRLTMDIYSADGSLQPGTYTACAEGGVVNEGEFGIGYDTTFYGMQMSNWGTCWWTIVDGAITGQKIVDGTVTVTKMGDVYTILVESTTIASARFKGKLEIAQQ